MRNLVTALLLVLLPIAAAAQDSGLKSLETSDAGRAWLAVGRLDIDGTGFCTGALIAPSLVLTAAHCLFDKTTRERINPARIEFLAGFRRGRALAYRAARRAVIHPDYRFEDEVSTERVRNDLALIELWQPIRNSSVVPFETGGNPARGEEVGIVSYAQDRAEAPSLQEVCSVMARNRGMLVMTCDVDFGASGAPIFSFSGDRPRIVSVVSAKAELDGQRVALGTSLNGSLQMLQARIASGHGQYASDAPDQAGAIGGVARNRTGAKFVRP